MKKLCFSAMIIGLVLMLTSCYFFLPLSAEVTIENNTDKTFYYLVSYNSSCTVGAKKKTLVPGQKVSETLKGHLTEADYNDSTEFFGFYYMTKEVYDAYIEEHDWHKDNDWFVIMDKGETCQENNRRCQNYKVEINPSDGDNFTIVVSYH